MTTNRLLDAVSQLNRLVDDSPSDEEALLAKAKSIIAELVAQDDWLPEAFSEPHPQFYRQYLLYGDPLDRFSLVSFVWGPGQTTPIHNHTVWGIIGMLRGAERDQGYRLTPDGPVPSGDEETLEPGQIACVSPTLGDIHKVSNAFADEVSISIHLYGGNIGAIRRSVFDASSGQKKEFVSGYSNAFVPNLWA